MAQVIFTPGNEGPTNAGEQRVLERLAQDLPDEFIIIPNLEVPVGAGNFIEVDLLVVATSIVWVVEVKDHQPAVEITQHEYLVGGESREHAVLSTRRKCQKLNTLMRKRAPRLASMWFQPVVVLAQTPEDLTIDPLMMDFVRLIDQAASLLAHPASISLFRDDLTEVQVRGLRGVLDLEAKPREPRFISDHYIGTRLIAARSDWEIWIAEHRLFKNTVELHVRRPPAGASDPDLERSRAIHPALLGRRVANHPNILAPADPFFTDDGAAVLVLPTSSSPTLSEHLLEADPDESARRKILLGVARAVSYCHRQGLALRSLSAEVIRVSGNGTPVVSAFLHAHQGLDDSLATTPPDWTRVIDEDWLSPEHVGNGTVSFPADIWAVGRVASVLWPDGPPTDLAPIVDSLLIADADARPTDLDQLITTLIAPLPEAPPQPVAMAEGVILGARYELLHKLGETAFNETWEATDGNQGTRVVIKSFDLDLVSDEMKRRCADLARIKMTGVVDVHDATVIDGRWVLVMEYLEGNDLDTFVLGTQLSESQAVQLVINVLDTLDHVHPVSARQSLSPEPAEPDNEIKPLLLRNQPGRLTHNNLSPQNVLLVDGRGPVLIDFGLPTLEGGLMNGDSGLRPPGAAVDSADPDVDLFAVGQLLSLLITGSTHEVTDRVLPEDSSTKLSSALQSVIDSACNPDRERRYSTASAFIQALVGLGLPDVDLPTASADVVDLQQRIWSAVARRDWDEALAICPREWSMVHERIVQQRAVIEALHQTRPLLTVHGFSLIKRDKYVVDSAMDTANMEMLNVEVTRYIAQGRSGEMIEVLDHRAHDPLTGRMSRWVQGGDTFQTDMPLKRLGGGLRFGRIPNTGDQVAFELRQARIEDANLWSSAFKATIADNDAVIGGDFESLMREFGASDLGTRGDLLGDTSNRKNYLCFICEEEAEDVLAVAYFLTRVIPLAQGVTN